MHLADIRDFRVHLTEYLRQVEEGETVTVTRKGKPVATVSPPSRKPRSKKRLTDKQWLKKMIREGYILPPEENPPPLPRHTKELDKLGRLALAEFLRMRRREW